MVESGESERSLGDPRACLGRIEVLVRELNSVLLEFARVADVTPGMAAAPAVGEGVVGELQAQQWSIDVGEVAAQLSGVSERLGVLAAQSLVDTGAHRGDAVSTASRWMERHVGLAARDAQRLVRCGEVLRHLDEVRLAFHGNEVRLAHVDAIARIVPPRLSAQDQVIAWDAVADSQEDLIEAAGHMGSATFGRFCRRIRDRLDLDGPRDRAGEPSRVWLSESFEGRWALSGDLSADDGALLATWLDKRRRAVLQRRRDQHGSKAAGDGVDRTPLSEIDAEALVELVRDGAGARRPGRVGLMLHMDLRDLSEYFGDDVPRRAAHTDANLDISTETLWALLADADVTPVFWDSGQPLSFGRSRRLAPEVLRQVLAHRDRTCRVPGCETPASRSDVHHTRHWERGGRTDPSETTDGCRFHHNGHHTGALTIEYDPVRDEAHARLADGRDLDPTPRWKRHRKRRCVTDDAYREYVAELRNRLAASGVRLAG